MFYVPDSNVKLAENPFININPRCMSAILDPERATECSRWCTFAHLHNTKCTPGGRVHNIHYTGQTKIVRWYRAQNWTYIMPGTWQFVKPSLEVAAMQVANASLDSLQSIAASKLLPHTVLDNVSLQCVTICNRRKYGWGFEVLSTEVSNSRSEMRWGKYFFLELAQIFETKSPIFNQRKLTEF